MTNSGKIRVTILDDHQSIKDGYLFRLSKFPEIEVVATLGYGDELEASLAAHPADVLILDVGVPVSAENPSPYPILHAIPSLLQLHAGLNILVISMFAERRLIRNVMEAGANGYILKDDSATIQKLGTVVLAVASGGIYFSPMAHHLFLNSQIQAGEELSSRQLEALSMCAAFPERSTADLAKDMLVAHSTLRNLLSGAYVKLGVNTRAAAIAKAKSLGIITPFVKLPGL
jgi:DNA-binding NarL/FixJ family response regulator